MIRGVFFDAGNTVVFPDYDIYRDIAVAAGAGAGVRLDDVVTAEARARTAFERAVAESSNGGVIRYWSVYYTPFYERLGVPADALAGAIERTRAANDEGLGIWKVPVEGLEDTVGALRRRGLAVGIVSNSDGRLERRLGEIGIRDHFDFVIDSAVVGVSKPDPGIFRMALGRAGLGAADVVYVGDYYEVDVVGARAAGMAPVLFDPVGAYGAVDCPVVRRFGDVVPLVDSWMERE
ncbi:MAG: HAD-IA family hydrolase [Candidatus Eisenbacteria bacterium]|nr:HAD-IA family hydrolase [Candidatus Eisenbacteria bacterium]